MIPYYAASTPNQNDSLLNRISEENPLYEPVDEPITVPRANIRPPYERPQPIRPPNNV